MSDRITTYSQTYATAIPNFYIRLTVKNGIYSEYCFREKTHEIRPLIETCPIAEKIRKQIHNE